MNSKVNSRGPRSRPPTCSLCQNHDVVSLLKGHKHYCVFSDCRCTLCCRGRANRDLKRKQVRYRRHQNMQGNYVPITKSERKYSQEMKENRERTSNRFIMIDKAVQTDEQNEQFLPGL